MKEKPEVNYVPTVEGLKALYDFHGEQMATLIDLLRAETAKVGQTNENENVPGR